MKMLLLSSLAVLVAVGNVAVAAQVLPKDTSVTIPGQESPVILTVPKFLLDRADIDQYNALGRERDRCLVDLKEAERLPEQSWWDSDVGWLLKTSLMAVGAVVVFAGGVTVGVGAAG